MANLLPFKRKPILAHAPCYFVFTGGKNIALSYVFFLDMLA